MSVDKDTVLRIAKLARIAMDDAQAAGMEAELNALLAWVEQLSEVDCENVPPMTSVVEQKLADARGRRHRWRLCRRPDEERAAIRRAFLRGAQGRRVMAFASDPTAFTLAEAREALRSKAISARELAASHVSAIASGRAAQRVHHRDARARVGRAADISDSRIARRDARPLEGLPLAVKDLFCTKGVRTTAASRTFLENFVPTYESTVTRNLWDAGAVMLGKTNLDEFAMGSSNESSHFGPAINPWRARGSNSDLVPGGSSGGSAAAVAANLALAATGTDTGGSIRQPAAMTGTVGLKPTYGRCSRWGIVAYASSLDQAGPMTRTVTDAAILLSVMASHDAMDSTSADIPVPDYEAGLNAGVKGLRVGIPKEYRVDGAPLRDRCAVGEGCRVAEGPRRGDCRGQPAAYKICARRPTTSWRRPKPRPISRATTACATDAAPSTPTI